MSEVDTFGLTLSRRALLLGSAAVVAMAGGLGAVRAAGQPLIVAIGADLTSLDPHKFIAGLDHAFFSNVFESLVVHDQEGNMTPALAESFSVSEDGLVHTFNLRPNVTWHNGDPFTAEDVHFTWKRSIDPAIGNSRTSVVSDKIADIEIVDPLTVRMVLKKPDASLHENMPTYFYMVPKAYIEKVGDEEFGANPVGTGPFRYTERRVREYVKFAPYEGHWRAVPNIGEVTLRVVPDEQTRMAQAQTGEAQIVTSVPLIFAQRMANVPGFDIVRAPSFGNAFFVFNNRGANEQMHKPEVRRAINLALNREALAKAITFGFASMHTSPCTTTQIACDVELNDPYAFNPDEAKRLLEAANYDFSRPIRIVGPATGRVIQGRETVEAVAQSLAQVGIKSEIEILEYGTWATVAFAKEKDPTIDMYLLAAPDASRDSGPRQIRTLRTGEVMSFFSDEELDAALNKLGQMKTTDEYSAQLREVFNVIHEKSALVPLWAYDSIYAIRDEIDYKPFSNVTWPILWNVSARS
jgi:peptide/nickel transport system substrate-binding protein